MNLELKIENPDWEYKRKERAGGVQYIFTFENGYGASIIKFWGTYGYEEDLWELAVLKNGSLHYDNPVADGDVQGYLTDEEVNNFLREIEQFKGGGRMKGFIEVELDMTVTTKKLDLNIDGINAYEDYTIYLKHDIVLHQKISDRFVTYKYLFVKETREEIKKKIEDAQ